MIDVQWQIAQSPAWQSARDIGTPPAQTLTRALVSLTRLKTDAAVDFQILADSQKLLCLARCACCIFGKAIGADGGGVL